MHLTLALKTNSRNGETCQMAMARTKSQGQQAESISDTEGALTGQQAAL